MEVSAMRIRTATDLGAFIRERRTKLGMDQSALAEKAGTSRKWVIEVEQGKPRAEIGLILRTLKTLGVSIAITADAAPKASSTGEPRNIDINNILDSLKKRS
jgi:HTH-type transcriptional regulator/antitoxin HipB